MAILNIINIQINTNQSHIKIPLHTSQLGYHNKRHTTDAGKDVRNWTADTLLMGM